MRKLAFKELKLSLPRDVIESISNKEMITLLLGKALSKTEYYLSKCREFEEKYSINIQSFKEKIKKAEKEIFTEWDDLIVWEGYDLGYKEWKKKYEELRSCIE